MLPTVLIAASYTAIVVTVVYIVIYSKMYSWWKHQLGLVMNLSIIAVCLIATGVSFRFVDPAIGTGIAIIGWFAYSVLLLWRLRLLISHARQRQKTDKISKDVEYHV